MNPSYSFLKTPFETRQELDKLEDALRIFLGPTGKIGLWSDEKKEVKFLTNGSFFFKQIELSSKKGNVLKKIIEQASGKTHGISGDGSTTTVLFSCHLLKLSLLFLEYGYNNVFLSNGLKKIAFFFGEKVLEFSISISTTKELFGILSTTLGKKLSPDILDFLGIYLQKLKRDGLIVVEENTSSKSEMEIFQGIELEKGFASSYFVNDLEKFQAIYERPYILIAREPIHSFEQITEVISYAKTNNRPLVFIVEEIKKEILSSLILQSIQKKLKCVVIKYSSIKFFKTGILEDLALLTHSTFSENKEKKNLRLYFPTDLGQAEKVCIQKEKSIFFTPRFSKVVAKRKMNELNRELLTSETDFEKEICKTRIARLSGNFAKLKLGLSNQYQIQEERQKIENFFLTLRSSLEEGVLPGAGVFYLSLQEELSQWSSLNLLGDELFSSVIVYESLAKPFSHLCENANLSKFPLVQKLQTLGYPYGFDLIKQQIVHCFQTGLLDSSKSVRAILWNSLSVVATLLLSD